MFKLFEKLDGLFEVKQTKFTGSRIFVALCLMVVMLMSLPMYFKYENYRYQNYYNEYIEAKNLTFDYAEIHGKYPIGEKINLKKEKDLYGFLNNYLGDRQLYYINTDLIPEMKDFKYTYIFDTKYEYMYTSEFVVYKMRRWHLAR
ncbi:hypothetical protein [Alkaliphilus hydrothermalis]|uniref:DUF3139 domain-containing protein n=1 Tax=Alkaliphilus hydrothermalis TaxID=1482730 RepID=A0ABS2NMY2_9FIRM|nr:hypothetical protein [Alkaliphilus hydrothermalis]MBM7614293.1 hypothetical protein [Alkaliphilus hydrothermalis]